MTRTLSVTKDVVGSMTVADLELLEERTGRPLSRLFDAEAPRGVLLHALAYIVLRRDDPDVSWEDAGDVHVDLEDVDEEVGTTSENPTRGGRRRRAG